MSNYTKSTDFAAKDALLTGNPSKLVKGTEIDTEFNNIATAIATKINSDSELNAIAGLTSAANKLPYFTGSGTAAVTDFTAAARTVLDDATVADMRTTLGAGDTVGPSSSVDSEIALFNSTTGKLLKSATTTGILKGTSGVLSAASAGTDYATKTGTSSPGEVLAISVSDESTAITTGTEKVTFRMPFAMTLTAVRASLSIASSSGLPTFDINEGGATILSTKITIDANERTSTTAATAPVISDASLADDAEITIDIDVAGTGAKGAKVYLIGYRT